jgi:hypothetical protein
VPFFNVSKRVNIFVMNRLVLPYLCVCIAVPSMASDFGTTGLIDIPTARMSSDGTLTTTAAIQSRTNSYAITYQAMPWLEATFRYTGLNDWFYWDRNYEAKVRLWEEQEFLPQVAVGIRDMVGTGFAGAEYIVASKEMGSFDVTLGMGWGRLAGKGLIRNPATLLSSNFNERETTANSVSGSTGVFQPGLWFSGEKVGVFGGVRYQSVSLPISLMLEYNPDQYETAFRVYGVPRPKSPFTAAVKWDALPGVSLILSHQHNEEWGIELSAALDTKSLPAKPSNRVFRSSLDYPVDELPAGINPLSWYDTLLFDVERSGILLLEATVDETSHSATIVMGNLVYPVWADAVDTMANLADLHLPTTVNSFNIVIEEEGHRLHSISMRRPSLTYGQIGQLVESEIRVEPIKSLSFVQHKTSFVQKKVYFDVNLSNRLQLFDPDDPARYQLYAKVGVSLALPKSWVLTGAYGLDITNNFDESNRINSDSVLPRVRSDIVKYLTEGDTGLDSLYLEKRGTAMNDIHYRVFGGVLESMFSGFGGELLYQPYQSRLAYGVSANWVQQRDYDKSFKHLDYKASTAFASVYWATPFYNFDVAVHAGKYLAKDVGATLEVRRTFHNGWSVGLWATKTDVSAEDFGEGSFDKGMYFRIPFNGLLGTSSRSNYSMRLRPIQRDGGQRLEDFSANIWWDTRGARYDAFSEMTKRLSP